MQSTFHLILFAFIFILFSLPLQATDTINVMSFNIRYNNPADGENAWPNRKAYVASLIRFHKADVVGLQEAKFDQLTDLQSLLPEYAWLGVGRDDGKQQGEFAAILYRPDRFNVKRKDNFWLSQTPDQPSEGWDANIKRITTWAEFSDKFSGHDFYLFNSHFDHRGEKARNESARLIHQKLAEIAGPKSAVIVTGDFNAKPDSVPYQILMSREHPIVLQDSWYLSPHDAYGPSSTWSGFTIAGEGDSRIDYVFVNKRVKVIRVGALGDSNAGRFPSDHLPVLAEVVIQTTNER